MTIFLLALGFLIGLSKWLDHRWEAEHQEYMARKEQQSLPKFIEGGRIDV